MSTKQPLPSASALFVARCITAGVAALLAPARAPGSTIIAIMLSLVCVVLVLVATYATAVLHGPLQDLDRHRVLGDRGPLALRPAALSSEQVRRARELLTRRDNTVAVIARPLGVRV